MNYLRPEDISKIRHGDILYISDLVAKPKSLSQALKNLEKVSPKNCFSEAILEYLRKTKKFVVEKDGSEFLIPIYEKIPNFKYNKLRLSDRNIFLFKKEPINKKINKILNI